MSPATWGGLGALVLLLGALSLVLLGCDRVFQLDRLTVPMCEPGTVMTSDGMCQERTPNYYSCECECSKGFSSGALIEVGPPGTVNVRESPAGAILGQNAPGTQGTIINGPVDAILNGVNEIWWQVDFASGVDGWVVQRLLTVVSSDRLLGKDLQVCLPPELNANLSSPPFEGSPTPGDIVNDCSPDRVAPAYLARIGALPAGSACTCQAKTSPTEWVAECDAGCTEPDGVCTVAGTDPPEPTPDPLSAALFAPTSTCEVTGGDAEIHLGDEVVNTSVSGVVQIHGRPCLAGQVCRVGMSYQLRLADISIPVRFHKDPKFEDLAVSGATEPLAVELAPFLPGSPVYVGNIPAGTTLNSARGRKVGSPNLVIVGRNGSDLDVAVDWVNKRCLLNGSFVGGTGGVVDDDGNTVDLQLYLTVGGTTDALSRMVNQPPRANAGPDQTLECTSPAGAAVSLSAAGTTDADGNIAFYTWRRGTENGPHVAAPSSSPALTTQQPIGETNYFLRAADSRLAADSDSVKVTVVDTGAPVIDCQAPATIRKHNQPIAFRATAADTCGGVSPVVISNVECFKVSPDGRIKANPSCKASVEGDTLTIGNSAGADLIRWQTRTADATGNPSSKTCEIRVD